jgi:prokaryotic YEATS domain
MNGFDPAWIPLYQTALWMLFVAALLIVFWSQVVRIVEAIQARIGVEGAAFEVGPGGLKVEGRPPPALKSDQVAQATAEGAQGAQRPPDVEEVLTHKPYPDGISEDYFLVHSAQVLRERTESSLGLYRVRVWLETWNPNGLKDCIRVTYKLHETFGQQVIATESAQSAFDLWLTVYGEFTIIAYVERRDGAPIWLARYLNLPGRPPD